MAPFEIIWDAQPSCRNGCAVSGKPRRLVCSVPLHAISIYAQQARTRETKNHCAISRAYFSWKRTRVIISLYLNFSKGLLKKREPVEALPLKDDTFFFIEEICFLKNRVPVVCLTILMPQEWGKGWIEETRVYLFAPLFWQFLFRTIIFGGTLWKQVVLHWFTRVSIPSRICFLTLKQMVRGWSCLFPICEVSPLQR